MSKSNNLLKKFVASKSKYFELPEGEEIKVRYLYAEEVPNNFDGGKTMCIRYHIEVDGVEQLWDRTSRDLAQQMANVVEGECIYIRREGERSKTKYFIRRAE